MVRARAASHADFGEPTRISRVLAAYDDHDIGARCELGGAILALRAHGIASIVAANAMFSCHSTDEYTTVEDLKKTALLVARLITDEI